METKLETVEKLMELMKKHRINKAKLDGIELECTHFPVPPLSAAEIEQLKQAKSDAESEALLWSAG